MTTSELGQRTAFLLGKTIQWTVLFKNDDAPETSPFLIGSKVVLYKFTFSYDPDCRMNQKQPRAFDEN